ncbi:MAG: DUF1257 domain-containing protein [Gemmataceae bacterium]|nr:DUF1257 domain-containing protein [Gemmataceae bacterium]
MSAVAVVTPIVIANWPAIAAAVTAAVSSLGFTALQAQQGLKARRPLKNRAEVAVEDSAVVEGVRQTEQILVERPDGVRATINQDAHGRLKVCVEGDHLSKAELREIGEELVGRITQQYVYHKLMTELHGRGVAVVEQETTADQTIKIRVRNS